MIEIRELSISDFDNTTLINSIYGINHFVNPELSISELRQIFELKRPNTDTFIAVDTDKNIIIGHAAVNIHFSFNGGRIGILYDVAISDLYQGQGIGLKLVFFARDEAGKRYNLTRFAGPVTPDLEAFYQKIDARDSGAMMYSYSYPKKEIKLA